MHRLRRRPGRTRRVTVITRSPSYGAGGRGTGQCLHGPSTLSPGLFFFFNKVGEDALRSSEAAARPGPRHSCCVFPTDPSPLRGGRPALSSWAATHGATRGPHLLPAGCSPGSPGTLSGARAPWPRRATAVSASLLPMHPTVASTQRAKGFGDSISLRVCPPSTPQSGKTVPSRSASHLTDAGGGRRKASSRGLGTPAAPRQRQAQAADGCSDLA